MVLKVPVGQPVQGDQMVLLVLVVPVGQVRLVDLVGLGGLEVKFYIVIITAHRPFVG